MLKIGDITYKGTVNVNLYYIVDPNTMTTTQYYLKMTLKFTQADNPTLFKDGSFTGSCYWTAKYTSLIYIDGIPQPKPDSTTLEMHGLLFGFDAFRSYTLHLGTVPPMVSTSWVEIR
jgi:hypothetical protein